MVDIFSITPHKVSKDLKGYTVMLYGEPKTGKTTTAAQFPKSLLLAFETGFLTIPGVMAQPIDKWSDFKKVLKQLKEDTAKEMYQNVIIDTCDIAYDLAEKYICNQQGVSKIGEIAYGQGWTMAKKEFDEALRSIPQAGYGLVLISHSQDKTFKDEAGEEYNQIVPTLANGPRLIVDRMSDIIGYAHPEIMDENGTVSTVLYMRGTPRFVAGSRFKYTPNSIQLTYDNLVNAIGDAIDKEANSTGKQFVTEEATTAHVTIEEKLDFNELMKDFKTLVAQIREATGPDFSTKWAPRITEITNNYLGIGKKVAECTPEQTEQLDLILTDLKEAIANGL